jgi:hypothetical protein
MRSVCTWSTVSLRPACVFVRDPGTGDPHFDINGDGTICARPYSALPNGGPPKKAGGVAVDNTVVGLPH